VTSFLLLVRSFAERGARCELRMGSKDGMKQERGKASRDLAIAYTSCAISRSPSSTPSKI